MVRRKHSEEKQCTRPAGPRPGRRRRRQEDEVVVVIELRPLAEVLRILKGERMELEDIAQYGEVLILRPG
jgi:hypothetical protein